MISVDDIQKLAPDRFEMLIARLLEISGFSNVVSIGGTGDEGIDLRAEWVEQLPTGDKRTTIWAIQCKRYSSAISPQKIQEILNTALEPPSDIFQSPPDFFLLATSSRLTTAALRLIERANKQRSKYSCRFIVWDGEKIAQKASESEKILGQFFTPEPSPLPRPQPIPATRITILLDTLDDRAILIFLCETQHMGPVTLWGKTEIPLSSFEGLTQKCHELTTQVVISAYTKDREHLLKETGKIINDLIPDLIKEYLSGAGDVYLRLESNIHLIPFEIAYDEVRNTFLGAATRIGRIQISTASPQQSRWPQPSILLVGAIDSMSAEGLSFHELPWSRHEIQSLSSLLTARGFEVEAISGYEATLGNLHRLLSSKDYQIIHFSGHGISDPEGKGGILLADGVASYEEVTSDPVSGSLIFLSACSSGRVLNDISRRFFLGGAQALIGFIGPVTDEAANLIAMKFYEKVAQGETLGVAMREAREFQRTSKPEDWSWVSFVIFGDPTITMNN